jgi:transposase InsO family protein
MRALGLRDVKRSKRVFTTKPDPAGRRLTDLVQRHFCADAPRRLWVFDVTDVRTWQGFAYVTFITDVFSHRIAGWNIAATLKADILPLQALAMADFDACGDLTDLTLHSDDGSNYMAVVYRSRIAELGAIPSTGTVGDSYDKAIAEAINSRYKTELIRARGPWCAVELVELSMLEWT